MNAIVRRLAQTTLMHPIIREALASRFRDPFVARKKLWRRARDANACCMKNAFASVCDLGLRVDWELVILLEDIWKKHYLSFMDDCGLPTLAACRKAHDDLDMTENERAHAWFMTLELMAIEFEEMKHG